MENASKALIMAGGVLIGILILSLAVYLFIDFGGKASVIHDRITSNQLTQFNAQFNVYVGRKDVTIYQIISLVNLAKENNEEHQNDGVFESDYKIEISLDSQNDRLRLGMNAKLSIITEMEENVWTVPYNAIYEKEEGTHYIEIAKDETGENKEELEVEIGIEGTYYTQIKSDKIKSGMKIVLPKVESGNSIESLIEMMGADAGI